MAGSLQIFNKSLNLRRIKNSLKLGRNRAPCYLGCVHGATISLGLTPGCVNIAGVAFYSF